METEGSLKQGHTTLRKRLGEKRYREHMAIIGARGGKKQVKKGFAITHKHLDRFRKKVERFVEKNIKEVQSK